MTAGALRLAATAAAVASLIAGPPVLRGLGAPGVLPYLAPCALAALIALAVLVRTPSGPCRPVGQEAAAVLALGTLSVWLFGTLVYKLLATEAPIDEGDRTSQPWIAAGLVLLVAPLVEELVFRGALQRTLQRLAPRWPQLALLGSAAVFAAAHHQPAYTVAVAGLGLLCGLAARLGNSLLPAVLVHTGFNTVTMLAPADHLSSLAAGPYAVVAVSVSAAASALSLCWLWRRAFPR